MASTCFVRPEGVFAVCLFLLAAAACGGRQAATPAAGSGDPALLTLASEILEDYYRRHPTGATDLGIHKYDEVLDNYSRDAVTSEVQAVRQFRSRLDAADPAALTANRQLDREQLIHALDSRLLTLEVVRPWAKDPDLYPSGITNTAYVMIKRNFAPPEERLRLLIAREKAIPGALAEARANINNPPRIYTEIAIQQIDGNRDFFRNSVPQAFVSVTNQALLGEFRKANDAVIAALAQYKTWLQKTVLPNSKGEFALGPDVYKRKLWDDEMIDLPLEELLRIAETNLKQNQAAFAETAQLIDPKKTPLEVLASLESHHPPPDKLLSTTQSTLDALKQFMIDRRIVTIPPSETARVKETPPFMRATTSASMDTPGPFETVAREAYYNMTLPEQTWPPVEKERFMRQWYFAAISNVSVHEVWPGHYLQFLYAKEFPSDVRKVFGAASNSEGWAHYCEQMVLDEGFHANEPEYRLAQLQDALLRNARFIVGIKLHTQGMTLEQARDFFVKEGYQPPPVADSETKRGTSDATYGYYTMGKLMLLKLRADYKAKLGPQFTLQNFHDTFIRLGPLPLPLIRRAMVGGGDLF